MIFSKNQCRFLRHCPVTCKFKNWHKKWVTMLVKRYSSPRDQEKKKLVSEKLNPSFSILLFLLIPSLFLNAIPFLLFSFYHVHNFFFQTYLKLCLLLKFHSRNLFFYDILSPIF